jgi:hypothetical protein
MGDLPVQKIASRQVACPYPALYTRKHIYTFTQNASSLTSKRKANYCTLKK